MQTGTEDLFKQKKKLELDQENWFKWIIWPVDHTVRVSDYMLDLSTMCPEE